MIFNQEVSSLWGLLIVSLERFRMVSPFTFEPYFSRCHQLIHFFNSAQLFLVTYLPLTWSMLSLLCYEFCCVFFCTTAWKWISPLLSLPRFDGCDQLRLMKSLVTLGSAKSFVLCLRGWDRVRSVDEELLDTALIRFTVMTLYLCGQIYLL